MKKVDFYCIILWYDIIGGENVEKLKKSLPVLAVVLIAVLFVTSLFNEKTKTESVTGFAMGSPVNITV